MHVTRGLRSTSMPYVTENEIYSYEPIEENRLLCTTLAGKFWMAMDLVSSLYQT